MNEYLFSYGTLQDENVQMRLFGRKLNGIREVLKGYNISSIEITDETFLSGGGEKLQRIAIPSTDSKDFIEGLALEITAEELFKADSYEPDGYKRIKVTLESGKETWIYVQV